MNSDSFYSMVYSVFRDDAMAAKMPSPDNPMQ